MTRFAYSASNSAAALPQLAYRQLVEVGVTSGTLYCCTGAQFLYTLGNTYTPVGPFGGIEPIQEESDPFPRSVRGWLSAVDSASMYEPLREDMFGRNFVVRHVYLNPDDFTTVTTPELLWTGKINKVELRFTDVDRGPYFEVEAVSDLAKSAPVSNFNLETHWITMGYSGDMFFSLIDQVPLSKAMWGQQPTYYIGTNARADAAAAPTTQNDSIFPYYMP